MRKTLPTSLLGKPVPPRLGILRELLSRNLAQRRQRFVIHPIGQRPFKDRNQWFDRARIFDSSESFGGLRGTFRSSSDNANKRFNSSRIVDSSEGSGGILNYGSRAHADCSD